MNYMVIMNQKASDYMTVFKKSRRALKEHLEIFEEAAILNAPKIGIEVKLFDRDIKPGKDTKFKLHQNFKHFMQFYGLYLEPFSVGKDMICYFCSECECIIFATKIHVDSQTHLKNKVFSLEFLLGYYTKERIAQENFIDDAWSAFKSLYSKGFPEAFKG